MPPLTRLAAVGLILWMSCGLSPATVDDNVDILQKWLQTTQSTVEARSGWQAEKSDLEQRNKILQSELSNLQKRLKSLQKIHSELIQQLEETSVSFQESAKLIELLIKAVGEYETKLENLLTALPPPLAEAIYVQIGNSDSRKIQNIGARYQSLITSLVLAHRFNSKPNFYKEIYSPSSGETVQMDALYWGIGLAYRVTPDGSFSQIGRPIEGRWVWEESIGFSKSIREFIDAEQGETTPTFSDLPVFISQKMIF